MTRAITLEALEVLDAIERKGSFAAAAASLHKVPSAISYTVQKLEQDLGVTLFQKQGRRSMFTNAGRLLTQRGRDVLIATDELACAVKQTATGWEPRLRIAVDHVVPADIIHPVINDLYTLQPGIDIEISEEVLGGTWEALIENRVDLCVGASAPTPGHKGIRCIKWLTSKTVFVAAPNHPICRMPQPLSDQVIGQYRAVVVHDSSTHQASVSRGILTRKHFVHVPNMTLKIRAHCHGLGIGSVPSFLIQNELANGQLVALNTETTLPDSQLYIAWKISNRGQALHWLAKRLLNQTIC